MYRKYHNTKVTCDGQVFDSKHEARRYRELLLMEQQGIITDLQRQVKFTLLPAQREPDTIGARGGIKRGKIIEKECTYYADFVYVQDGKVVVEDAKGFKNDVYRIKRKMMLYFHGIQIKET